MGNSKECKKKGINKDVKFYDDGIGENSPEDHDHLNGVKTAPTGKSK